MPKKKDPFKAFFNKFINSKSRMLEQHLFIKTDFNIIFNNEEEIIDDDDIFNEETITSHYFPTQGNKQNLSENSPNFERKNGNLLEDFFEDLGKDIVENQRVVFRTNDFEKSSEITKNNSFNFISYALWKIESYDKYKGGIVQWEKLYRFKHFFTGKYLTVSEKEQVMN